jgi:PAS domain S-box-containing protein
MPGTEARTLAEKAIQRLRKEGGLFVDAVRATRMAMAVTDPTLPGNPIVFTNDAFLKLSGYRMEEVLGQQPYFMNGPDTDADDVARFQEALRNDQDDLVETIQYRKDGTRFIASVLLSAFKDDDGNTVSHFLSWLDVTRRTNAENRLALLQQAQTALRQSEHRTESALLAAEMGTWDYDLVADVCHFDARAQQIYNLPSDQLDHRPDGVASVVHPDDIGPMFDEIQRATDPKGNGRYDIIYRIAQADGTYRYLRAVGIAEFEGMGEARRAVRIVGASRDITVEKEAATALRESEALLSAVLDVLPLGVGLINADGDYVILNKAMERFLPTRRMPSRDPERGRRWRGTDETGQPIEPNDFPGARAFRGESVIPGVEMLYQPDEGPEIWTNVAAIPLRGPDGEITSVLNVVSDVDAVKRSSEALKDGEQHQRLLLAELQHRVRNSLAVVRSIARRTADNSSSVEEMLGHFQGRLDAFSRVQAALTRTASAKVELMGLVEDELLAHAVKENGNLLIEGPEILLDPRTAERLSLAIHELTTNAVKHGALGRDSGKILIRWEVEDGEENGKQFNLVWRESGVGLTRTKVKREGFGMDLLRHSLPYDLQAETKVELTPDGLHFELKMPLPRNAETQASSQEPVLTAD